MLSIFIHLLLIHSPIYLQKLSMANMLSFLWGTLCYFFSFVLKLLFFFPRSSLILLPGFYKPIVLPWSPHSLTHPPTACADICLFPRAGVRQRALEGSYHCPHRRHSLLRLAWREALQKMCYMDNQFWIIPSLILKAPQISPLTFEHLPTMKGLYHDNMSDFTWVYFTYTFSRSC